MPPFFPHGLSKPRGPLLVLSPNSQALTLQERFSCLTLKIAQDSYCLNKFGPLRPQPTGPFLKGKPEKEKGVYSPYLHHTNRKQLNVNYPKIYHPKTPSVLMYNLLEFS